MRPIHLVVFLPALLLFACSDQPVIRITGLTSPPTVHPAAEPFLFTDSAGTVWLSWVEERDSLAFFRYASLHDTSWSEPITIHSGYNWFVNWADYPMFVRQGSHLLAAYLRKSGEETFSYDVALRASEDDMHFTDAGLLNRDSLQAEHGFVSLVPYRTGIFASWLDGRHTAGAGGHEHEGHSGEMSVRAALLRWNGEFIDEWELDNRVCDCCQTTSAIVENGPVVIYRDRSREEVRDMSIVRWVNGKWTSPQNLYTDAWKISGCPVNGPRCEARGNALAIAWFSMANDSPQVKVIFSMDGGATFGAPVQVNASETIGRVDLVLVNNSHALVSWIEQEQLKVAVVNQHGKISETITVTGIGEARSSGFPQLTAHQSGAVIAWTNSATGKIETAKLVIE
jgi:hypothetical protein